MTLNTKEKKPFAPSSLDPYEHRCEGCGRTMMMTLYDWGWCKPCKETALERAQSFGKQADSVNREERIWRERVPDKYHIAAEDRVRGTMQHILNWVPGCDKSEGCGIYGNPGAGKSMTIALLMRRLGKPFVWINGSDARQLISDMAMGEGNDRKEARTRWERLMTVQALVLDDVDKAKFTEAWTDKLFHLLEKRTGAGLPTFWTANNGPGVIGRKIGDGCGDSTTGAAIERRLCQKSLVLQA